MFSLIRFLVYVLVGIFLVYLSLSEKIVRDSRTKQIFRYLGLAFILIYTCLSLFTFFGDKRKFRSLEWQEYNENIQIAVVSEKEIHSVFVFENDDVEEVMRIEKEAMTADGMTAVEKRVTADDRYYAKKYIRSYIDSQKPEKKLLMLISTDIKNGRLYEKVYFFSLQDSAYLMQNLCLKGSKKMKSQASSEE